MPSAKAPWPTSWPTTRWASRSTCGSPPCSNRSATTSRPSIAGLPIGRQQPDRPAPTSSVGTGLVTFDGEGQLDLGSQQHGDGRAAATSGARSAGVRPRLLARSRAWPPPTATLAAARQDGSPPGTLTSYMIGEDGVIRGVFSSGVTRDLGQIRLARFANPAGLVQRGENMFRQGLNSGLPIEGNPDTRRHRLDHRRRGRAVEHRHRQEPDRPGAGLHAVPRQRPRHLGRPAAARRAAESAAVEVVGGQIRGQ